MARRPLDAEVDGAVDGKLTRAKREGRSWFTPREPHKLHTESHGEHHSSTTPQRLLVSSAGRLGNAQVCSGFGRSRSRRGRAAMAPWGELLVNGPLRQRKRCNSGWVAATSGLHAAAAAGGAVRAEVDAVRGQDLEPRLSVARPACSAIGSRAAHVDTPQDLLAAQVRTDQPVDPRSVGIEAGRALRRGGFDDGRQRHVHGVCLWRSSLAAATVSPTPWLLCGSHASLQAAQARGATA